MKLIRPCAEIMAARNLESILKDLELYGRTCYKSEDRITSGSGEKFIKRIIANGHHSVLEHHGMTVKFVVDRGVSHELVRHRLASYSQESTRYCNYKGGVMFVIPPWEHEDEGEYEWEEYKYEKKSVWFNTMLVLEQVYKELLLKQNYAPQQARSVLPNSLKTEVIMTANLREWRHVFSLRTTKQCHPQMREVMCPLLGECRKRIPIIFDDVGEVRL